MTTGYPSVGSFKSSLGFCTATLIGYHTVLTAGHCVEGVSQGTFKVGGKSYPSKSIHPHPSYNRIGPTVLVKAGTGKNGSPGK